MPILFLSFLTFNYAIGQSKREIKQALKERDKYVFAVRVPQKSFTENVHFETQEKLIIISVTIDGKVYHFLYDTGAMTVISSELKKELGLEPNTKHSVVDASGTTRSEDIYSVDSLSIGGITFQDVGTIALDLKDFNDKLCYKIDGLLGANLMRTCYWKIDFASSLITFSDTPIKPLANALAFSFSENMSGSPEVNMGLEHISFKALWDCGNNGYIDLQDSLYFKSSVKGIYVKGEGNTTQTLFQRGSINIFQALIDTMYMDKQPLIKETARLLPFGQALIGIAFMRRYGQMILDWKEHKIYLNNNGAPWDSSLVRTFGFTPDYNSGVCTVAFLWDGSLPAQKGIQLGDTITDINGKPMAGLSHDEWCTLRKAPKSEQPMQINIRHEGKIISLTIPKYDLFKAE